MVTALLIMILFAVVLSNAFKTEHLNNLKTTIMGELEDINAQLDRIDAAHAGIKKDLDFIKIQLPTTGGIDAAAVAAIKARVTGIADKLESLDAEIDSDVVPEEPEA